MKLPNGYGSVFKLGGNRRRPWAVRVTVGWTEEGKQIYKYVGYYKTKAEAMQALAEYHKDPAAFDPSLTLAELRNRWRESVAYTKLSAKTQESYDIAWKHLSALGGMSIRDIRASHLQAVIDGMAAKGLSHSSCHKVKVLAGLLFKVALADGIVNHNYAELIVLPERENKKKDIFSDFEIKALERLAETDIWAGTILILIYTGMRISELLTLTKFNVDLDRMLITGGVKTDAGKNRIVPIHPKIQEYVRWWYDQPGSHLITRNGEPIRTNYYRTYLYYPTLERAGVRRLTPHATRHTFGTLLDRAGVNTKHIQELMGHADYSTTANIYTHPDVEALRKAIERL